MRSIQQLLRDKVKEMICHLNFTGQKPLGKSVFEAMSEKPRIQERRHRIESATRRIMDVAEIFA